MTRTRCSGGSKTRSSEPPHRSPDLPLETAILAWLADRTAPVTVWEIRAGVGSDVGETFRALAALVVRGSVERDGAMFRLAGRAALVP